MDVQANWVFEESEAHLVVGFVEQTTHEWLSHVVDPPRAVFIRRGEARSLGSIDPIIELEKDARMRLEGPVDLVDVVDKQDRIMRQLPVEFVGEVLLLVPRELADETQHREPSE